MNNNNNYQDIINLPHHISKKRQQMPISDRAAQFAPFAALTGYEENIKEATRLTDTRIEIDEERKLLLNDKLQIIINNIKVEPMITFTYFIYDNKKSGGKYIDITNQVKKINITNGYITLIDKTKIPIEEIIDIQGEIFKNYQIDYN